MNGQAAISVVSAFALSLNEVFYARPELISAALVRTDFFHFQDAAVADIDNLHLFIHSVLTVTEQFLKFSLHNISETVLVL